MLRPPSTVTTAPLTKEEAGSARLSTMCATSSGSPYRRSGTRRRANFAFASSGIGAVMAVLIGPGQTQFTVTPRGPELDRERTSEADHTVLARGVRADERRGAESFGRGDVHDAPGAVAFEMGKAGPDHARVRGQVHGERGRPRRFEVVGADLDRDAHARVVDEDVDRAELPRDLVDDLDDRARIGDVERPTGGQLPGGDDLAGDRIDTSSVAIGDRDLGAFVGEQVRDRASHSARGTRHDHDFVAHAATSTRQTRHGRPTYRP